MNEVLSPVLFHRLFNWTGEPRTIHLVGYTREGEFFSLFVKTAEPQYRNYSTPYFIVSLKAKKWMISLLSLSTETGQIAHRLVSPPRLSRLSHASIYGVISLMAEAVFRVPIPLRVRTALTRRHEEVSFDTPNGANWPGELPKPCVLNASFIDPAADEAGYELVMAAVDGETAQYADVDVVSTLDPDHTRMYHAAFSNRSLRQEMQFPFDTHVEDKILNYLG